MNDSSRSSIFSSKPGFGNSSIKIDNSSSSLFWDNPHTYPQTIENCIKKRHLDSVLEEGYPQNSGLRHSNYKMDMNRSSSVMRRRRKKSYSRNS